jgi:predicted ATPase with chaperone activity
VFNLDELHERSMRVPEVMRQPIEQKIVTISQTLDSLTFVSNYQLIAVMNLWACSSI